MITNQKIFVAAISFSFLLFSGSTPGATCPPPQQPILGNTLQLMIRGGKSDDAMQCVRELQLSADNYPDEVRYQLATNASDAIEALGGDAIVFSTYTELAANLWDAYLQNVSTPFDPLRISFALTKVMQHGRFGKFEKFIPSIAKAFNHGAVRISTSQADQLFTTVKRCPNWNNVSKVVAGAERGMSCTRPCPDIALSLLANLGDELGPRPWVASAGSKRLSLNSKALEDSLQCKP